MQSIEKSQTPIILIEKQFQTAPAETARQCSRSAANSRQALMSSSVNSGKSSRISVCDMPVYVDFYDPHHSDDEERYLIVGQSNQGRLLIVSYTERKDSIRIISK
jgi:Ribonuclease toxin, BrnT, of type II toxin-antitoxin system